MAERHAMYIFGEPGIGKSTLVDALTGDATYEDHDNPFAYRRYDCGPLELGKRRDGGYPGTDALSMSVQPTVIRWLKDIRPRLLLGEGARLANDKFFTALFEMGYTLHLYHLVGRGIARERRAMRGSHQNQAWLTGRLSACIRLGEKWSATEISAVLTPEQLSKMLYNPVAEAFRS